MRVLFLHREESLASTRVRILDLIPHLEALGVECQASLLPSTLALRTLVTNEKALDAIVLQKKLMTPGDAWALRRRDVPMLFDFDDAIFVRQRPRRGSYESRTRARRFARTLESCDAFVCGNEYLASFCRETRKPILVAPSAVPLDVPRAAPRKSAQHPRIGWLGSPGNLPSLIALAPVLRTLAERHAFRLVVISESCPQLPGVPVEHVPWTLESQELALAELDIGLMPLEDSPWARGKCGYKLLQYMAAGVPVVASAVGMNATLVQHGENGLLADDDVTWLAALERLLVEPRTAARIGAAGRDTALRGFGYPSVAGAWHQFLEELCCL